MSELVEHVEGSRETDSWSCGTLVSTGDWGMLGRVRDFPRTGLCSFLSRDITESSGEYVSAVADVAPAPIIFSTYLQCPEVVCSHSVDPISHTCDRTEMS